MQIRKAILIVDDDAAFRKLVAVLLEESGYETREAATGEEALASIAQEPPRLLVLDVHLPGLSGYEVCRKVREELGDDLPIIFVSGERTESFDRVAGLIVGCDDYLAKPFAPDELLERVRGLLRRTRAGAAGTASPLTKREHEVLELLAAGRPQPEIARELVISPKTVGTHIERILGKLGAHSRAEAVAMAYRDGLVSP